MEFHPDLETLIKNLKMKQRGEMVLVHASEPRRQSGEETSKSRGFVNSPNSKIERKPVFKSLSFIRKSELEKCLKI